VGDPIPDVDDLVVAARDATGCDDLGGDSWREGLERLRDALLAEGRLNDLGTAVVSAELTGYLETRLRLTASHAAEPALARDDVVPPIVIVGQARTGTTILHDLLAQDPASRVPLTWEVDQPFPAPETATYDTDPRIDVSDTTLAGIDLVLPEFRAMHPMGARLPQECVRMTGSEFRSMIFPTQYRVPSYARWLLHEADMAPAYRWHRRFLQHLQSRHPTTQWVLKSPGHIWCLGDLLAEYPGALLVQTHRDPLRIVASLGSLIATLRRLASDDTSISEAAAEFAEYMVLGVDRSLDARLDGTVPPDRVVDVHFRAFMADPFATIHTVYERLGLELTDETEARMRTFLAEHSQERHGAHRYSWADTGLDEGEWRERARRYQEHFDVASEPLG
jgi:hypothetical protein